MKDKPYVPDITCPHIDHAISLINIMSEVEDAKWRIKLAKLIIAHFEFLREANSNLRESGRYWYEKHKNIKQRRKVR